MAWVYQLQYRNNVIKTIETINSAERNDSLNKNENISKKSTVLIHTVKTHTFSPSSTLQQQGEWGELVFYAEPAIKAIRRQGSQPCNQMPHSEKEQRA